MKKFLALSITAIICIGMTACGGSNSGGGSSAAPETEVEADAPEAEAGEFADGEYTAEMYEFDETTGYKDNVTVVISGGKITSVLWNATKEDGSDKRSLSESGEYGMKAGGASSEWHEQAAAMEAKIIETQDPYEIPLNDDGTTDAVSGVTIYVEDFLGLVDAALADAY